MKKLTPDRRLIKAYYLNSPMKELLKIIPLSKDTIKKYAGEMGLKKEK